MVEALESSHAAEAASNGGGVDDMRIEQLEREMERMRKELARGVRELEEREGEVGRLRRELVEVVQEAGGRVRVLEGLVEEERTRRGEGEVRAGEKLAEVHKVGSSNSHTPPSLLLSSLLPSLHDHPSLLSSCFSRQLLEASESERDRIFTQLTRCELLEYPFAIILFLSLSYSPDDHAPFSLRLKAQMVSEQEEEEDKAGWRLERDLENMRQAHEGQLRALQVAHADQQERARQAHEAEASKLRGEIERVNLAMRRAEEGSVGWEEVIEAKDRELANLQVREGRDGRSLF